MRQRVMIAIALANEPDVIIADEPTTALDVTTQAQILDLLTQICVNRGTAIVLITHNLGIVAGFCDSVYVMYAGRIVERSPTSRLFSQPAHPYTEALLRSVPRSVAPGEWLYSIPGAPPDLARPAIGCSFNPRCSRGAHEQRCADETPVPFVTITAEGPVMAECHFAVERVGAYPEMAGHAGGEP
jgi:oligopeptide/dipeptide ABC transporter ATP-binding protein